MPAVTDTFAVARRAVGGGSATNYLIVRNQRWFASTLFNSDSFQYQMKETFLRTYKLLWLFSNLIQMSFSKNCLSRFISIYMKNQKERRGFIISTNINSLSTVIHISFFLLQASSFIILLSILIFITSSIFFFKGFSAFLTFYSCFQLCFSKHYLHLFFNSMFPYMWNIYLKLTLVTLFFKISQNREIKCFPLDPSYDFQSG